MHSIILTKLISVLPDGALGLGTLAALSSAHHEHPHHVFLRIAICGRILDSLCRDIQP